MRFLTVLFSLALVACSPDLPNRLGTAFSGDFPRLLNQSELAALWAGPSDITFAAPDLTAGLASRLAALRARAEVLRAYRFDNSALQ